MLYSVITISLTFTTVATDGPRQGQRRQGEGASTSGEVRPAEPGRLRASGLVRARLDTALPQL